MRIQTVALLLLLTPALAAAQNRQDLQMLADIRQLQEQVGKLQLSANQLAEALVQTNKRIDDQAALTVKTVADQKLASTTLSTMINTVREKLDDNTVRVASLTQEFTAIRSGLGMVSEQLNTLVGLLQPPVNPDNPEGPTDGAVPPVPGALGSVSLPPPPGRLWNAAMADYVSSDRLESAIQNFEQYIQLYPTSPDAPRAQSNIGQAYYTLRKYNEAIAAFAKVITNYKTSEQAPEALYMQGVCYLDMGQRANAQKIFDQVVKQYPPDNAMRLQAEQRLKTMSPAK